MSSVVTALVSNLEEDAYNIPENVLKIINTMFADANNNKVQVTLKDASAYEQSVTNLIEQVLDQFDSFLTQKHGRKYEKKQQEIDELENLLKPYFKYNKFEKKKLLNLKVKVIIGNEEFCVNNSGFHTLKVTLDNKTIATSGLFTTILENFATAFKDMFTSMLKLAILLMKIGSPLFDLVKNYIIYIFTMIGRRFTQGTSIILEFINLIAEQFNWQIEKFTTWQQVLSYLTNTLGEKMMKALAKIDVLFNSIREFIQETWPKIKNEIIAACSAIAKNVLDTIGHLLDKALAFLGWENYEIIGHENPLFLYY